MPFADAMELADDFKARPPVHLLVAGYMGVNPQGEDSEDGPMTIDDARAMRGALGD